MDTIYLKEGYIESGRDVFWIGLLYETGSDDYKKFRIILKSTLDSRYVDFCTSNRKNANALYDIIKYSDISPSFQ